MKTSFSCRVGLLWVARDSRPATGVSPGARGSVTIRLLLLAVLAAGVVAVILDQKAVGRLRSENQSLRVESQEAKRLAEENSMIPQLRQASRESETLRVQVQNLPGLRNKVRQLRRQADELQKTRSENERLMSEPKAPKDGTASPALPADFISRAALGDAGLGTPEAAAQTVMWAMSQGNFQRLAQCLANPPPGPPGSNGFSESDRQEFGKLMSSFAGFRISERKDISDTEVLLSLQSSVGGDVLPMTFKRVGSEWKVAH